MLKQRSGSRDVLRTSFSCPLEVRTINWYINYSEVSRLRSFANRFSFFLLLFSYFLPYCSFKMLLTYLSSALVYLPTPRQFQCCSGLRCRVNLKRSGRSRERGCDCFLFPDFFFFLFCYKHAKYPSASTGFVPHRVCTFQQMTFSSSTLHMLAT